MPSTFDPDTVPHEYWAVFGLNRDEPLLEANSNPASSTYIQPFDNAYTPWPTALRFTMVIHDPDTRLENGQTVQFVVPLPERCQ